MTNTTVKLATDDVVGAARELARAGRWRTATDLLDGAATDDPGTRARLALASAEVALESDWFCRTGLADRRLCVAVELRAHLAPDEQWSLEFARLRHDYASLVFSGDGFSPGPRGKDPGAVDMLRRRAEKLCADAPDETRHGWARFYLGVILDNVCAERDGAPAHYEVALTAGDRGDPLLAWEALRHLGDHDHDRGDGYLAAARWARATSLGAGAGAVPGTLTQQLLLAVLARDAGDEAGAVLLGREVARWAAAIGAAAIEAQARAFVEGDDPTAAPPEADA
ncbi:MAG TPA: hypothetical protein VF053_17575 [Streptosporangiales bacterium]